MIRIDLWDRESLIKAFAKLYDISEEKMIKLLQHINTSEDIDIVDAFFDETQINLDAVDVSENVELLGKIVASTIDNNECLSKLGIKPLDILLENDSPISRHLKEHGIRIVPSNNTLEFKAETCYIPNDTDEECKWCIYGSKECIFYRKQYKNLYCDYRAKINTLSSKLYYDKSEIELFLFGEDQEMKSYSNVSDYPEILDTVDMFFRDFYNIEVNTGSDWKNKKQYSNILSFWVKYNDLSYKSGYYNSTSEMDAVDVFDKYNKYNLEEYYSLEDVPNCFWNNIWIIRTVLYVLSPMASSSYTIYAGIKHDISIPFENISVCKF